MENKELVAAVEELIQETRCPICLDFFVRPRTAPCTHSFCEACIYECIKDNHSECPSCRYPGCNKRALSLNHTLMNLTATVRKVAVLMGLAEESLSQVQHEKELWKPDHQRNSGRAPTVPKKRKRKGGDTSKPVEPVAGEDAVPPVAGGSLQAEQAAAGSSSAGAGEGAPGQTAGSSTARGNVEPGSLDPSRKKPRAPERPVVLMTGIASGTTATSLNGAVMTLGGRVARTFDLSVSHVVCRVDENRNTPRTLKYCCGLLSGAHLVSPAWVRACQTGKGWRAPEAHEQVQGCTVKTSRGTQAISLHKGPRRRQQVRLSDAREREAQGAAAAVQETDTLGEPGSRLLAPKQLGGRKFLLLGAFEGCPSKADLVQMVSLAGGALAAGTPTTQKEARGVLCVRDPRHDADHVARDLEALGVPLVTPNYILDCVSHFEPLDFRKAEFRHVPREAGETPASSSASGGHAAAANTAGRHGGVGSTAGGNPAAGSTSSTGGAAAASSSAAPPPCGLLSSAAPTLPAGGLQSSAATPRAQSGAALQHGLAADTAAPD